MKRKHTLLLAGAWLALLAAVVGGVSAILFAEDRPVRRLADGGQIALEGVFYHAPAEVRLGEPWKRKIGTLLPFLQEPLNVSPSDALQSHEPGSLVVWLNQQGTVDREPVALLVDNHGCRIEPWYIANQGWSHASPPTLVSLEYPFFPRRDLRFRLLAGAVLPDTETPEYSSEFSVANPAHHRYPTWQAEALPVFHRSGPLTVTLTELEEQPPTPEIGRTGLIARYAARENGRTAPEWQPVAASLSDAMGGTCRFYERHVGSGSPGTVALPVRVCREEAYRLRVEFSPYRTPGARPDAVWKVAPVAVARNSHLDTIHLPQGVLFRVQRWNSDPKTYAYVEAPQAKEGMRFRLRCRDERGRVLAVKDRSVNSRRLLQRFEIAAPASTRQLHFTVELFRSRFAEWKVKPTRR